MIINIHNNRLENSVLHIFMFSISVNKKIKTDSSLNA